MTHPKRNGFSLVELLIVLAVVGLLLSLLLPSLMQARLNAKRLQAMVNVRTMVQGYTSYAIDNKNTLYPGTTDGGGTSPAYYIHDISPTVYVDHRPIIRQYNLSRATRHPMVPTWPDLLTVTGEPKAWPFSYWPGYGHQSVSRTCAMPIRVDLAKPTHAMFSDTLDNNTVTGLVINFMPSASLSPNWYANASTNFPLYLIPLSEVFGAHVGKLDGSVSLRKIGSFPWVTRETGRQNPNWQL